MYFFKTSILNKLGGKQINNTDTFLLTNDIGVCYNSLINKIHKKGEVKLTDKVDGNKGKEIFGRLVDGEDFDNISKDFYEFEAEVLNSPFILQFASKEEMASYKLIDELPDRDINQALKNMAEILEVKDEDEEIILSMNRYFLKLILIERWTEKAEESINKRG